MECLVSLQRQAKRAVSQQETSRRARQGAAARVHAVTQRSNMLERIEATQSAASERGQRGELREAAKQLAVELYRVMGPGVDGLLGHLRKKQKDEYAAAFAASAEEDGTAG